MPERNWPSWSTRLSKSAVEIERVIDPSAALRDARMLTSTSRGVLRERRGLSGCARQLCYSRARRSRHHTRRTEADARLRMRYSFSIRAASSSLHSFLAGSAPGPLKCGGNVHDHSFFVALLVCDLHGSSEMSLCHSDSDQALLVLVRTFPNAPVASANLATLSPLADSTIRSRSRSPEVR